MKRAALVLGACLLLFAPAHLRAQSQPLEPFVAEVARLWARGDVGGLVGLAPADGRMHVDVGTAPGGMVSTRHATAALRSLFAERESVSVRPARVSFSGGRPPRGFGELAWTSRPRGVTTAERHAVYVGAVWEADGWRIRELRVMR